MSDKEKIAWMRVLLIIWGSAFAPLFLGLMGAPANIDDPRAFAGGILTFEGIATAGFLLVLSWRAAYLSGRADGE